MNKISVTILTKNSVRYLEEVLEALRPFDEVVIYDNGSSDDTCLIAARYPNVMIHYGPFHGFGDAHNRASSLAVNDWVLSIDSDEVVTAALAEELLALELQENTVYSMPRNNYFNGKWIRWCGWYPDRQYRLYNRRSTGFSDAYVHEQIILTDSRHCALKNPIVHYSYASIEEFLQKMQFYSSLFASQRQGKERSSPLKAWSHGLFAFFKSYFLKRGFLGGYEGFVISAYNGHTAYYKYLKLYEANKANHR